MSVPIPEKKMAVFGLKPIRIGAKTVAPNMASTCCKPTKMDCPQGKRSSGAMMPSFFRVQPEKYPRFSTAAIQASLGSDTPYCRYKQARDEMANQGCGEDPPFFLLRSGVETLAIHVA